MYINVLDSISVFCFVFSFSFLAWLPPSLSSPLHHCLTSAVLSPSDPLLTTTGVRDVAGNR